MPEAIIFTVSGEPVPKARPRVVESRRSRIRPVLRKDGSVEFVAAKARGITPARTVAWEHKIGWTAKAACPGLQSDAEHEWFVLLNFCCRRDPLPDLDNLTKSVLDGLNGVVWDDDRQVIHLDAWKEWVPSGQGVQIALTRLAPISPHHKGRSARSGRR
jgi:crossover junction endodeoxyribonuclease RusA